MSEVRLYTSSGGRGYRFSLFGIVLMLGVVVATLPYVVGDDPAPYFSLATLFVTGWGLALVGGVRLSVKPDFISVMVGVAAGGAIAVSSMVLGLGKLAGVPSIPLFAAVAEETFFRGGLQTVFSRITKNPVIGMIFSAGTFALFHWLVYPGYSYSYFYPLLAGFVLAAAYEVTRDLTASMTAHLLVNVLASLG